ncbi:hypothetical protein IAU59_007559 [Kwoniella sp. CBS 9459]
MHTMLSKDMNDVDIDEPEASDDSAYNKWWYMIACAFDIAVDWRYDRPIPRIPRPEVGARTWAGVAARIENSRTMEYTITSDEDWWDVVGRVKPTVRKYRNRTLPLIASAPGDEPGGDDPPGALGIAAWHPGTSSDPAGDLPQTDAIPHGAPDQDHHTITMTEPAGRKQTTGVIRRFPTIAPGEQYPASAIARMKADLIHCYRQSKVAFSSDL